MTSHEETEEIENQSSHGWSPDIQMSLLHLLRGRDRSCDNFGGEEERETLHKEKKRKERQ